MDKTLIKLYKDGKISLSEIEEILEMEERKEILENHPFKIWQGNNGKWYTYLPDEKKGRIQKERTTKANIENLIIDYYKEKQENPTIKELFDEWINNKLKNGEIIKATYTRYIVDFERCFSEFGKRHIQDVTELDIENFLKSEIHSKHMTQKAYSNIRTLMYGIFKYAKKKKIIKYNIKDVIADIDFSKNEFYKNIHEDDEEIFLDKEKKEIINSIMENQDIVNLGLLLLFKSGMRIGELCSLYKTDVSNNYIKIRKTETIYKINGETSYRYEVKDYPKTEAGIRDIFIPSDSFWIIDKLLKLSDKNSVYLFSRNNKRIRSYVFRNRLYRLCKKNNEKQKSLHKIRKSYGTKLRDKNLPDAVIMKQMGHTDISCLQKHYYYNQWDNAKRQEFINEINDCL